MAKADKVVITCALTGAVTTKKHCPAIPYSAVEVAEEAKRAYDAGAAVVHIHAREDDGRPSWRWEVFEKIKEETRKRCPIILNFSTGAIGLPPKDRVKHITELKPDIGALNMGSMNYAKYDAKRKDFVFAFVFQNSFEDITFYINAMNESGVKPELECFDTGHVNSAFPLIDKGLLKPPLDFSLIMGVVGGIKATARHLAFQAENLPPGSTWKSIGISRDQWMLSAAALSLGGNVRVGLEDNFYLPDGSMAGSNGDVVAKAVEMARSVGREPATVAEARELLSMPARETA
jgi:uncharacterized protein (DUF849 family)